MLVCYQPASAIAAVAVKLAGMTMSMMMDATAVQLTTMPTITVMTMMTTVMMRKTKRRATCLRMCWSTLIAALQRCVSAENRSRSSGDASVSVTMDAVLAMQRTQVLVL